MLTRGSVNLAGLSLLSTCKLQLSGVIRPDKTLPSLTPLDAHGHKTHFLTKRPLDCFGLSFTVNTIAPLQLLFTLVLAFGVFSFFLV